LIDGFSSISIKHIPRCQNQEANRLAQSASGYRKIYEILNNGVADEADWRKEIIKYLKQPSQKVSRRLRYKATKFILLDDQLYYRTVDGVLLKCLNQEDAKVLMGEVHEGVCGAHQSAHKMKWLIRRAGYYWLTMLEDYFRYYKGCQDCQKFGNIQKSLASAMNPIIKPWPFRGWGIDLIGQVYPPSSKGHKFVLVAADYFTKWVEAIPLKVVTSTNVIEFIKEHIIYRFSIPRTITIDQGKMFTSQEFKDFTADTGFKSMNSSPYYA
jgi:hypothetical protein